MNYEIVSSRAGHRCEYCRCLLQGRGCQIEHIIPKSGGGLDHMDNYAAACSDCNNRKGNCTKAIDPRWGTEERFFNPRRDRHEEHFVKCGDVWNGRTAIGRATALILFRSTPQFVPADLNWSPLLHLRGNSQDEALYLKMNSLRSRQKRNDYSLLKETLRDDPSFQNAPFDSQVIAIEAKALIDGELRMLRSNPNDISSGLQEVRCLRRSGTRPPHVQAELFAIESIYLKQMATLAALDNNLHDANQLQQAAMNALLRAMKLRGEDASKEMWCARRFRMMALGARCVEPG